MDVTVADAPERSRFEAWLEDGTLAGVAAYTMREDAIVFTHTEVPQEYEGQGIAARIIRFALDDARARNLRVVALCPYVREFLRKHEDEYVDLVGHAPSPPGS
ncbi:MAG TPA: GNAT family N-acetyltransferase [Cellulomonas sp.]